MNWKKRIVDVAVEGILWGLYYWLLFALLIPLVIDRFLGGLPQVQVTQSGGNLLIIVLLFIGLSLAATALKGTIYSPLIGALESILGFAIILYFMNGGVITASLNYGGPVTVTLDISPILWEIFLFFTMPGAILPFVEYFMRAKE